MTEEYIRLCPECHEPLEHRKYKVFHNWVCPIGHGTLYPQGELEHIIQAMTGIEGLDLGLWKDPDKMVVERSHLMSPEGPRALIEIRDSDTPTIGIYGDPKTHSLWIHAGEEEKMLEYIQKREDIESVSTYLKIAAKSAWELLDDEKPITESTGRLLLSLKLLGERIMKAMPFIAF